MSKLDLNFLFPYLFSDLADLGDKLVAVCSPGFKFSDGITNLTLTCHSNGKWNPDPSITFCKSATCYDPGQIPNSYKTFVNSSLPISQTEFFYPQQVEFKCNDGFWISPGKKTVCIFF